MIRSDSIILVGFTRLHSNPVEWIEPESFIPERFNHESPYSLTPEGKKRHPMSFGPFLGGKRVCLGKTFTENVAKCVVPVIMSQVYFEVPKTSDIYTDVKPSLSHFSGQPAWRVTLKEV